MAEFYWLLTCGCQFLVAGPQGVCVNGLYYWGMGHAGVWPCDLLGFGSFAWVIALGLALPVADMCVGVCHDVFWQYFFWVMLSVILMFIFVVTFTITL